MYMYLLCTIVTRLSPIGLRPEITREKILNIVTNLFLLTYLVSSPFRDILKLSADSACPFIYEKLRRENMLHRTATFLCKQGKNQEDDAELICTQQL